MESNISFTLKVWRQAGPKEKGGFKSYEMKDIPTDTSFLEMLDILNLRISSQHKLPESTLQAVNRRKEFCQILFFIICPQIQKQFITLYLMKMDTAKSLFQTVDKQTETDRQLRHKWKNFKFINKILG